MAGEKLEQLLAKRRQAQETMAELAVPVWITIVAGNEAEKTHLPLIGAPSGSSNRAYILTPRRAVAVSSKMEAPIQEKYKFETIIEEDGLFRSLVTVLSQIIGNGVAPIALNYSRDFMNVDTLGHGSFKRLELALEKANYFSEGESKRFIPADELIFAVASKKLPYEVELLREAALITNEVLVESFRYIESGMTEKEVADLVHGIANERISKDCRIGYSWERERNPIVLTGDGIADSPHMAPSDRKIRPGTTVYIDFGLSVDDYCGDLQHFGYVLKEGETEAPERVQEMFRLLTNSIEEGISAAVPGALGWYVDKACRDVIESAGHPTYKHNTGHQLGAGNTHAPGVSFGPRFYDYTNSNLTEGKTINMRPQLPLSTGYVMTIEPRIQIDNGASIEVDGIVTKKGFELFVPIQENIHLIK